LYDRSVWAIVAGGLAGSLGRLVLSHRFNDGPRDRLGWDREAARELEKFGRWVFFSTLVSFLASNLDRVVLGRLLTLGELGLYSIGMTFARVATQVATRLTNTVVFPAAGQIPGQAGSPARLCGPRPRGGLVGGRRAVRGLRPVRAGVLRTLYDERYAGAGRISQWLSIYIWTWILNATIDRIPLALGRPRALFNANLAGAFGMVLAWWATSWPACPASWSAWRCPISPPTCACNWAIPRPRAALVRQSLLATAGRGRLHLPLALLHGLAALHLRRPGSAPALSGVLAVLPLGWPPSWCAA
jgi:hypothetical protein